ITLTSLTTAVGFFSLTFSESPPFAHLGIISGIGVLYAWLLSLTLLPALLVLLPWKARREAMLLPDSGWQALHAFIARRPGTIVATALTLGIASAGFAFTNVLDDRYVEYFDERFEFRQATDYLNEHVGGFYTLEYSLDSGTPDGIAQNEYLRQVDALAGWLRGQPEVTHVAALSDIMRTVNRGMNGGQEEAYVLPSDSSRAAQYLMLYEMSLPVGLDLREQVTADKSASRMTVGLENLSTNEVLALVDRAGAWMSDNAPALAEATAATGTTVLFSHIGQRNIEQMLVGTFLALSAISLLLFFAFGSAVLGSAGIATNLVPPLASLGGWALVVGEVGMAVATIAAVTLGIVVDDTIHFIEAARQARRRGLNASDAVLQAMQKAGPGILGTTVVLAVGFACLALSGFQINAWMGLMTAIVICVAFVFDMLFLPALLIYMRNWK
ncbi:MAG: MMPL family transporter, partial [Pseudomonadota bacterium]